MTFIITFISVVVFLVISFYAIEQKQSSALLSTLVRSQDQSLKDYKKQVAELLDSNAYYERNLEKLAQDLSELKSQQQSKSVRLGLLNEVLIPLHQNFGVDHKSLVPMFRPVDYISFEDDKITFIEIKLGTSQLSHKQKNIKRLIEEGKVYFKEVRVTESGLDVK